ncbi:MAG: TlpA family protein disulfide reductase [Sphingomonas sp.]|nr:TlpA family protein disulfide reductase [Sphingomonas sp.]
MKAPELRVPFWIDGEGRARPPLTLAELGARWRILFCFQHWCAGCHVHGFPTLARLVDALGAGPARFAVIQTVFEGEDVNTQDKLTSTQARYRLRLPFGHDPRDGDQSSLMRDYRTGGTPWFIVIDPQGELRFGGFELDAESLPPAILNTAV